MIRTKPFDTSGHAGVLPFHQAVNVLVRALTKARKPAPEISRALSRIDTHSGFWLLIDVEGTQVGQVMPGGVELGHV